MSSGINGLGLGPARSGGDIIRRNTPAILNVAFNGIDENSNYTPDQAPMFWDNRASGYGRAGLIANTVS